MGYVAAGFIAAFLGIVELLDRLESRPTRAAARWWITYVVIELGFGALSYRALTEVVTQNWVDTVWGWIAAGLGVAGILRLRVTEFRSDKGELVALGPAYLYEQLRSLFRGQIDNIGASEQAEWITSRLIPHVAKFPPQAIGQVIVAFVRSSGSYSAEQKDAEARVIEDTITEIGTPDSAKREALVWGALELGGWRLLQKLSRLR